MVFADAALARRIEGVVARMGADCARALARLRPDSGATAMAIAGGIAAFAGAGSPLTQAQGLGLDAPVSDADLERIEAFYFERDSPAQVVACPHADLSLAAGLAARGYRPTEFENALYLPLGAESAPEPPDAPLARPATPAEADVWVEVVSAGFVGEPVVPPELREIAQIIFETEAAAPYLVFLDDEPAGGGSLFVDGDVALLAASSTLPHARNRGLHAALLHARLDEARRRGCGLAVMGALAGSGSQRNAERLGFRVAYTRVAFVRDRP
jgi:GNAT superfamily N-acetyltransferase